MTTLSLPQARRLALRAQLLTPPYAAGPPGAQAALEHLGYVQLDTISVVERAHHHVLWSRVPDYDSAWLRELVRSRRAFEYWAHAASVLPMRDYRFSLPRQRLYRRGKAHWFRATDEHRRWKRRILARIRAEGPLSIRDFAQPGQRVSGGWFERSPAKQALEQLFMEGRILVHDRRGFEKIYDLAERVLPANADLTFPSEREEAEHLVRSFLRAHAFGRPEEIAYLRSRLREPVRAACRRGLREGELREVKVHGVDRAYLALSAGWEEGLQGADRPSEAVKILSPFDNQVIQRARVRDLFGFDYLLECYVPEAKRRFGYFCLPLLVGERFAGRIDAKAEREQGVLRVRALHAEPGFAPAALAEKMAEELTRFARFNGCTEVRLPRLRRDTRRPFAQAPNSSRDSG